MSERTRSQGVAGAPGPVVLSALVAVLFTWVVISDPRDLIGDTSRILSGEVWRLVTASLVHQGKSPWHALVTLVVLYSFGTSLESLWGRRRMAIFLLAAGTISYALSMGLLGLTAGWLGPRLAPNEWFGGVPVVNAVILAWALHHRESRVLLLFIVPVSARALLTWSLGITLVYLGLGLWLAPAPEGLIAPLAGFGVGWLLGGSTPSPVRRWWLGRRLARLQRQATDLDRERKDRIRRSGLRVLPGGGAETPPDREDGGSGRWLN